jgi:molybdate transport system ATP-binding protein
LPDDPVDHPVDAGGAAGAGSAGGPVLDARIEVRLGDFELDLDLRVDEGEVVALLGPNGAGKTTALRTIAGLQPLDGGRITLDGNVLDDPAAGRFVATGRRPIGVVFQDYLLFPRLSALDNVAFGLRARGLARSEARALALDWLRRLDVEDLAGARPRMLSGGQAQRVALARALATDPRLLLLDEPLAALDASTRLQVRTELRRHLATFPGARLLITHDPVDAIVLADRLVILEAGRVTQTGTPAEVTARPRSRYVAELVGINLLHGGAVDAHTVRLASGAALTVADALPDGGPDEQVAIALRPQAIALHRGRPDGSPRNTWSTTVADLEADRDRVRVTLDGPVPATAEVTPAAVAELELEPGTPVWASVKATDLTAYRL